MAAEWMQILCVDDDDMEASTNALNTDDWAIEGSVPEDVADEDDAAALLAVVKDRLAERGESAKYQKFLEAVSAAPPKIQAAERIIADEADLLATFKKCFGGAAANLRAAAVAKAAKSAPVFGENVLEDRSGTKARVKQLVQLLKGNQVGHEVDKASLRQYALKQAEQPRFPRRLFILRGPPALGKSTYAESHLLQECKDATSDLANAKLTHICSTDDFFMQYANFSSSDQKYVYDRASVAAHSLANEARVRLAMEAGIEPLYVDNGNMRLSDMRAYVMLADRLGYVLTVVAPHEISTNWSDVDSLIARMMDKNRKHQHYGKPELEAMVQDFEDLTGINDPRPSIRASENPEESFLPSEVKTLLPPTTILYKFEQLVTEGTDLLRYTPPNGRGWGVMGQVLGEWQSFRERKDGSCIFDDGNVQWCTEDPETAWSFTELFMLEDIRKHTLEIKEAALPTNTSHPALFGQRKSTAVKSEDAAKAPAKRKLVPALEEEEVEVELPSMSRKERFKHRLVLKVKEEEQEEPRPKAPKVFGAEYRRGMPTEQEENSAATFLGAVKSRLIEWGKPDQYHEFVCALSGSIDAKAAVRILRGHDDLLFVFRNKFAPRADLAAIKQELLEEDQDEDEAPRRPNGRVKEELGAPRKAAVAAAVAWGEDREEPHAPAGPPPRRVKEELGKPTNGVKQELSRDRVKTAFANGTVKVEDMPRPPRSSPHTRGTVTLGDDSDDDLPDEFAITAAVRKGRDSCIAELAKLIFRKERAAHNGARTRLDMVRYATKVAAKPRFPRELFILRGCPGIGKTAYALQKIKEGNVIEEGEELAARLTHVCSMDDFFEQFGASGSSYKFEANKVETNNIKNEARVRIAMEAGIHPLYVDCPNLKLWECRPYLELAERLGYVTMVVEPSEINEHSDNVDHLVKSNDTESRREMGKVANRATLGHFLKTFEWVPWEKDALEAVREAERSIGEERVVHAKPSPPEAPAGAKGPVKKKVEPNGAGNKPQKPPAWTKVKNEGYKK